MAHLLLLCVWVLLHSTALTQRTPARYSRLSACLGLESPTTSCVVCDTQVTVDAVGGRNCSGTGRSLAGLSCSSLEDVVESVAVGNTQSGAESCVEVLVQPQPGDIAHQVLARENRVLRQNLVIRGTDKVGQLQYR